METNKLQLQDVTFLIPIRVDSLERLDNLQKITNFILGNADTNIMVLEASDRDTGIIRKILHPEIYYAFIEDNIPVFHRTRYLNVMTQAASTPYVAIWDSDVLVPAGQLMLAVQTLREERSDFVFPYDGRLLDTESDVRRRYFNTDDFNILIDIENMKKMHLMFGLAACGGGFLVNRERYCEAGMENENFFGWGIEDGERVKRWEILGYKTSRIMGPMYHFTHPRGLNSNFGSNELKLKSLKEYLRICRMSRIQLKSEVATWTQNGESLAILNG